MFISVLIRKVVVDRLLIISVRCIYLVVGFLFFLDSLLLVLFRVRTFGFRGF